ncbi:2199_t:CDS:2, partial [Funneliformis caledonium]
MTIFLAVVLSSFLNIFSGSLSSSESAHITSLLKDTSEFPSNGESSVIISLSFKDNIPLKQNNDPKNPYTTSKPANITPKQPINKPNPPPTFQSNKPKQPFNNKGEETLDASIHAHSSWADDYDHNYNYRRPNDNKDQNEQPYMLTKISNQLETIAS